MKNLGLGPTFISFQNGKMKRVTNRFGGYSALGHCRRAPGAFRTVAFLAKYKAARRLVRDAAAEIRQVIGPVEREDIMLHITKPVCWHIGRECTADAPCRDCATSSPRRRQRARKRAGR